VIRNAGCCCPGCIITVLHIRIKIGAAIEDLLFCDQRSKVQVYVVDVVIRVTGEVSVVKMCSASERTIGTDPEGVLAILNRIPPADFRKICFIPRNCIGNNVPVGLHVRLKISLLGPGSSSSQWQVRSLGFRLQDLLYLLEQDIVRVGT